MTVTERLAALKVDLGIVATVSGELKVDLGIVATASGANEKEQSNA